MSLKVKNSMKRSSQTKFPSRMSLEGQNPAADQNPAAGQILEADQMDMEIDFGEKGDEDSLPSDWFEKA